MAQPPTIYKPGKLNYLWNYLGSSLKSFAAALSPYINSGPSYKVYTALLTQPSPGGDGEITAVVIENTTGLNISYNKVGTGTFHITCDGVFPGNKTFAFTAFPGMANNGYNAAIYLSENDSSILPMELFDYSGVFSDTVFDNTPIEIRIYP